MEKNISFVSLFQKRLLRSVNDLKISGFRRSFSKNFVSLTEFCLALGVWGKNALKFEKLMKKNSIPMKSILYAKVF